MGRSKGWAAERTGRASMPSPGRPQINQRPARQAFWRCIARGLQSEDAARVCGVSQPLGPRWSTSLRMVYRRRSSRMSCLMPSCSTVSGAGGTPARFVVVANEAPHSEANWQEIRRRRLPIPQRSELVSFKDCGVAVNKYGKTAGDVPGNMHVVYTSVGHEVRMWSGSPGSTAVTTALASIRNGSTFDEAYAKRVIR